jgi:hypothetical protein
MSTLKVEKWLPMSSMQVQIGEKNEKIWNVKSSKIRKNSARLAFDVQCLSKTVFIAFW